MKQASKIFVFAVFFVCMAPLIANAGAGANSFACIYLATDPTTPMTVKVTSGSPADKCMHEKGQNVTFTASKAGVTCGSIGYVEGKSSSSGGDLCATSAHVWTLSYNIEGTAYSGSLQAEFSHPFLSSNYITLLDQDLKGKSVCTTSDLCSSTKQSWPSGTQGPLYFIFNPAP